MDWYDYIGFPHYISSQPFVNYNQTPLFQCCCDIQNATHPPPSMAKEQAENPYPDLQIVSVQEEE